MNKDRLIGAGKQMLGAMKEEFGRRIGSNKLQYHGKGERIVGKIQNAFGRTKDWLKI